MEYCMERPFSWAASAIPSAKGITRFEARSELRGVLVDDVEPILLIRHDLCGRQVPDDLPPPVRVERRDPEMR